MGDFNKTRVHMITVSSGIPWSENNVFMLVVSALDANK